jgi:hypothetical protein
MNQYVVEARLVVPGFLHNGYNVAVFAATEAEAIEKAREKIGESGYSSQVDGPLEYRAIEY